MAIAELPAAFQSFKMDAPEWRACDLFLQKAGELAPDLEVIGPRRTQSGDIKIMLQFPERDTWDLTMALATICNDIRGATGVYLILD